MSFYRKLLYGTNLPFQIDFLDADEKFVTGLLSVKDDQFKLDVQTLDGEPCEYVVKEI